MKTTRLFWTAFFAASAFVVACDDRGGGQPNTPGLRPDGDIAGGADGATGGGAGGGAGGGTGGAAPGGQPGGACPGEAPPATCAGLTPRPCTPRVGTNGMAILRGTVVTPDEVLCDGEVMVERAQGRIVCVGQDCGGAVGAAEASVVCADLVLPGLIDPHNHMSYNTLPRWRHDGPTFSNRGQWNGPVGDEMYDALFEPTDPIAARYAELRLLLAGTTSVHKSQAPDACLDGVRNLDRAENGNDLGYSGDAFTECVFPLRDNCRDAPNYATGERVPDRRYVAHVSEGYDDASRAEFDDFVAAGQLGEKTTIIHCIACDGPQLTQVRGAGAALVWSPQSNIDLYGRTLDVPAALRMGIPVALGPDWTPSGTMNQLAEMKCAAQVSDRHFGGSIDGRDILRMVTRDAAKAMGIEDLVGTLEVGKAADVLALKGDRARPYESILAAGNADVQLVMIGGVAHMGAAGVVDTNIALNPLCETLDVCGQQKTVCARTQEGAANTADAGGWARFSVADHVTYLESGLSQKPGTNGEFAYAYNLYPLFECEPAFDCALGNSALPAEPTMADTDGDGRESATDNCPDVFNPGQGDLDDDGRGDACDVCPWSAVDCPCRVPVVGDRDGDGIGDADDLCPDVADPEQADRDADGQGDACDFCPDSPSAGGCPTTIYALKRGEVPAGTTVAVTGVVTAVVPTVGNFFMQVPATAPEYTGVDDSGVFVFIGNGAMGLTAPSVGDLVTVSGVANDFFGQRQLSLVSGLQTIARDVERPSAESTTTADAKTGGGRAGALEGARVCVDAVSVEQLNPPAGAGDRDPNNEWVVTGGLRVNDLLYLPAPLPGVGTRFDRLCGVLRFANGDSKLEPTSAEDLGAGPVQVNVLSPGDTLLRAGQRAVPQNADGLPLRIVLTGPAPAGGEVVALRSSDPGVLSVDASVTVPAGETFVAVIATGVAAGSAQLTASIDGRGASSADVRVLAADAPASRLRLTPEVAEIPLDGTATFRALIDVPAPTGGLRVAVSAEPASLNLPVDVTIAEGQTGADFIVGAGASPAEVTLTITAGALTAQASVRIAAPLMGGGLVINEVNYDMPNVESQEYVEVLNASNAPVPLAGWRLELVNGRGGAVYSTIELGPAGAALAPGQYLVVADVGVAVPPGALVVRLDSAANSDHNIENGDPDAVRLVNGANPDAAADGVAYGGPVAGAGEGVSSAPDDPGNSEVTSVGRCPNGVDTNDNAADFVSLMSLSPGAANPCP